jgi:hypothetical protein
LPISKQDDGCFQAAFYFTCLSFPDAQIPQSAMHFLATAAKLLLSAGFIATVSAHNIQLPAHGRECFHETLHRDDKMTVTFQVGDREFGSAGNLDIDFWVCMHTFTPTLLAANPLPLPMWIE